MTEKEGLHFCHDILHTLLREKKGQNTHTWMGRKDTPPLPRHLISIFLKMYISDNVFATHYSAFLPACRAAPLVLLLPATLTWHALQPRGQAFCPSCHYYAVTLAARCLRKAVPAHPLLKNYLPLYQGHGLVCDLIYRLSLISCRRPILGNHVVISASSFMINVA